MQKVKTIFSQTLMISTAILFGIGILMFIQHFVSGVQTLSLQWSDPLSICLTGFLSSLPTYFLLDMDSLKKSEVRIGNSLCLGSRNCGFVCKPFSLVWTNHQLTHHLSYVQPHLSLCLVCNSMDGKGR